jgi:hypothetical protein
VSDPSLGRPAVATPGRLLLVGFVLFLGSAFAFVGMWGGADLGCQRCDCRYRLLEGPLDCRWPAWWGLASQVLFALSIGAVVWAALVARRTNRAGAAPAPTTSVRFFGVAWPGLAILFASPFIAGALVMPTTDRYVLSAPVVVGALAAPGYLYALLGWRSIPRLPTLGQRLWVRASFVAAFVASCAGAVMSLALILPSIACFLTAAYAVIGWWRLEFGRPSPGNEVHG